MPVFRLSNDPAFPPPDFADPDGLLAVGGDLSLDRLLHAYAAGIFPWYSEGSPILWWSPDPRLLLFPDELRISRSLRSTLRRETFRVTFNEAFEAVIRSCAVAARKGQRGTWITAEMIDAYLSLHRAGFAISAESWLGNRLAGGLYGVLLGKVFFGESMFSNVSSSSKVALVRLVEHLRQEHLLFIDCQVPTAHLRSLGARDVSRTEFLHLLRQALDGVPGVPAR